MRCFILLIALFTGPLLADEKRPHITHAVLVHGIWESGKFTFTDLQEELEARGVTCLVPSLKPATARNGLMPLASQLKQEIDKEFGSKQPFLLVGFSMGGLVSRSYLQDLGGAGRCQAFVTISTPHHGTKTARFHPGKGTAEMRPGSVYLSDLELGEDQLGDIPIVSYRTPLDLVIVPSESSHWACAENVPINCPLHAMMSDFPKVRENLLPRFRFPRKAEPVKTRSVRRPPHRR